jgi:hypothetical protein
MLFPDVAVSVDGDPTPPMTDTVTDPVDPK